MKKHVITLGLIVLVGCRGVVYGMGTRDWWGPAPIDIGIQVLSAVTGDAIEGAVVRIDSLDEPRERHYTSAIPADAVTDDTGTAVVRVEFDGTGPSRDEGTWLLQGRIEIEREGYQDFSSLLTECTGRSTYPMSTERIYLTLLLDPGGTGECRVADPVVFDPSRSVYSLAGTRYDRDAIVEVLAESDVEDGQLQKLVDDYDRERFSAAAFRWSGALLAIGGGAAAGYYAHVNSADERSQTDTGLFIVSTGAAIAGAILFLENLHRPGEPTELVDYYNARHRSWGGAQ